MKRKLIEFVLAVMIVLSVSFVGCMGKSEAQEVAVSSASKQITAKKKEQAVEEKKDTVETAIEATVEQKKFIEEALPNLRNRLVVEKAKDVDLVASMKDESGLVKEIEVLSTDLEPEKVGTYDVIYKVTVYEEILEALTEQAVEKEEQITSATDTDKQTVVLLIQETVSVITTEEAEKLTEEGKEVLTDAGAVFTPEKNNEQTEKQEDNKKKDTEKKVDDKKTEEKAGTESSATDKKQASDNSSTKTETKVTPAPSYGQSSSGNQASETPTPTKEPQKSEAHTHTWVPQTKTVHHDAMTQMIYVVDQAAWDEDIYVEQPVYTTYSAVQCGCGSEFSTYAEWCSHEEYYTDTMNDYSHGSYSVVYHQEQTGTEMVFSHTVHHQETGHYENQVVKAAYDEEVSDGYQCSGCGARK